MRDFYVTFLDCDNTARLFTVEVAMSNDATVDDAKKYFYSQAGVPAPNGKELRALVFSVYDVQDIEDALRNRRQIPIEIQRYLGDFSFDESPESKLEPEGEQYTDEEIDEWNRQFGRGTPPPDDEDYEEGDEWKKLTN